MIKNNWPKKFISWEENKTLHISVVFTWDLPEVEMLLNQRSTQKYIITWVVTVEDEARSFTSGKFPLATKSKI